MPGSDALKKYLDALSAGYEILVEASTSANERGQKVSSRLMSDVVAAQRDALEFSRRLAANPEQAMSTSYAGLTEAALAAQGRAFAFAQLAYQETVTSNTELGSVAERLTEVNKEAAEAATELARSWSSLTPLADVFTRTMDAARSVYGGTTAKAGRKSA